MNQRTKTMTAQRAILSLLFAFSGLSGLIYESIWTEYLKLFLGHAAYAQALVIAVFMGGLALGSWLCSAYAVRWKDLLLAYAAAEAVIGVLGLLFHPVFDLAVRISYDRVIPLIGSPAGIAAYQWTLSTLLVLPQTVLLGATFPLMSAGLVRLAPEGEGKPVALLYFTNSLGAAAGALLSGFVLVRLLGLPGTLSVAGAVNLAVALCVVLVRRTLPAARRHPSALAPAPADAGGRSWYRVLLAAALLTGIASFIYEIAWVRMLDLVLGTSTHAFELMLSAFILGLALGGLWMRYRIGRTADAVRSLVRVQIAMGTLALLTLPLYGRTFAAMQWLMSAVPRTDGGYTLFNAASGAIALAVMFPTAFCAGMTLPLITQILLRQGQGERSIGAVYAANTAGAIIGVFFAIHVGFPVLGLKGLLIAGAGLDIALGVALFWRAQRPSRSLHGPAAAAAFGAAAIAATLVFVHLDPYKMGSGVYRFGSLISPDNVRLLYHRDGKTATVTVFREGSEISIRTNGKPDAMIQTNPSGPLSADQPAMVLLAALPLSFRPGARSVANIGFGSGLTTSTLLRDDGVASVDTVEIEPSMVEGARAFGSVVAAAYTDRRSRITIDDARSFLASRHGRYDIIVSEPSNPWVSGVAGLFSTEFYRTVSRGLAEGGVFCQWLQAYEIDEDLVLSILKAISENFADYAVYAAGDGDLIIVARSSGTIGRPDPELFRRGGLAPALESVRIASLQDLELRRLGDRQFFAPLLAASPVRANSDYHPVVDQEAARLRFLGRDVSELLALAYRPLPLTELLSEQSLPGGATSILPSESYRHSAEAVTAMHLRDYFLTGTFPEDPYFTPRSVMQDAARLNAVFFTDCRVKPRERLSLLYGTVALGMTPYLRPQELESFWSRLEAGACSRLLEDRERSWIALYKAIGRRDGREMADEASELLRSERDLTPEPLSYLVAAGMTGAVMQGEGARALAFWDDFGKRLYGAGRPSLLFRLLEAHGRALAAKGSAAR